MPIHRVMVLVVALLTVAGQPGNAQVSNPTGDFDLVSDRRDANGFLFNPSWRTTDDPRTLDPDGRCGILGLSGAPGYRPVLLRDPTCFGDAQRNILRFNEPRRLVADGIACAQAVNDGSPQGHLNWVPVTLEGVLLFRKKMTGLGGDFDMTFEFVGDERAPSTRWNGPVAFVSRLPPMRSPLHLEFDYRATTDRLNTTRTPWWTTFADLADDADSADSMLGIGRTVVTGLFNLDLVHYGHSEIHPIFGLAILVSAEPVGRGRVRHRWVFLVRDRGNQGSCSADGMMPLRVGHPADVMNSYRVRLRAPDGAAGEPTIVQNQSWVGASEAPIEGPEFQWSTGEGLQMEVRWPRPENGVPDAILMGDVTVEWPVDPAIRSPLSPAMQAALALRAIRSDLMGPLYYSEDESKVLGAPDPYYASLSPIEDWDDWSGVVTPMTQLPAAPPADLAPAEIFDRTPPVLACSEVKHSENPRCVGDWTVSPLVGTSPLESRGHRHVSAGITVGNVRHYLGGPVLRLRYGVGYLWRETLDSTDAWITEHTVTAQPELLVGPIRKWITTYLIVGPGIGAVHTEDRNWRASVSLATGLGIPLRPGQQIGANIEMIRMFRTNGQDYWGLGLRIPIALF